MNHQHYETSLPLYVSGQLDAAERAKIEDHLAGCNACQADLKLWQAISAEIKTANRELIAPTGVTEKALEQVQARRSIAHGLRRTWELVRIQARLVQREMWPASAGVMALGVVLALVSNHLEVIYFLAPMIAAATLAMLSGPENDPAYELAAATPTSAWKLLLARMSIVSAYNFLLALAATLALLTFAPPGLLGALALGWLAPMAFLSTLALLLSLWLGSGNAIIIAYLLWVAQYVPYQSISGWMVSPAWMEVTRGYNRFWQNPVLLLWLSVFVLGLALISANRLGFRRDPGAA